MKKQLLGAGLALAMTSANGFAAINVNENFSTDPFTRWSFGAGDNSNSQFVWTGSTLNVHLDSSLPTARLDLPLGATLTDATDFTVTTKFTINSITAPNDQLLQIAFGLVNHTATGGDRTGLYGGPPNYDVLTPPTVFNTVEFNYFPEVNAAFKEPTLSPVVVGANIGTGNALDNFQSVFGGSTYTVNPFPAGETLQATLSYVAAQKTLTLGLVNLDGTTSISFSIPMVIDGTGGYDPTHPFQVDSFAIMAYHDDATTSAAPSLVGDLTFKQMQVTSPVPEASTFGLITVGLCGVGIRWIKRRMNRS